MTIATLFAWVYSPGMKKAVITILGFFLGAILFLPFSVSAHRSGCHRWHSCPSDSGSYVCGDLGYTSGCPKIILPKPKTPAAPAPKVKGNTTNNDFIGKPTTYKQLYSCKVVGNRNSMIYHLKGSKYIKAMVLTKKECFANENGAIKAGFRKSKA
ncbi:MAG TPA: hypothetical protein VGQ87_01845 [Patescibacteria group bacterium]|jgi:hypothetical protein|nr:hypothetical protein [Patescibacteria group bacterium]